MVQTDCHLEGCRCRSQRTWSCSLSSLHAMFIMAMSLRTVLAYILQYPKCSGRTVWGATRSWWKVSWTQVKKKPKTWWKHCFSHHLPGKQIGSHSRKKENKKSKIETWSIKGAFRRLSVVISDPNSLKNQLWCHHLLCNQTPWFHQTRELSEDFVMRLNLYQTSRSYKSSRMDTSTPLSPGLAKHCWFKGLGFICAAENSPSNRFMQIWEPALVNYSSGKRKRQPRSEDLTSGAAHTAVTQLGLSGVKRVNIKMSICRPVLADKAVQVQLWWLVADFKGAEHRMNPRWSGAGGSSACSVSQRLWSHKSSDSMEEMGCLTDSQWAAGIFPDRKNSVKL